jgi:hemerythrin
MYNYTVILKNKNMPLIQWEPKFALGVNEIDEQHKRMLSLINKLYDLFSQRKHNDQEEIDRVIAEMADYAVYHFETEEKYFLIYNYEKQEEHVAVHNQYRAKIEEWRAAYDKTKDDKIFFEVSNFLNEWWTWHINNTDREYVPFMKANNVL